MTKADPSVDNKPVVVKKAPAKRRVRVGIVGCGGIGNVHMRTYTAMPEAEIVAASDLIQERCDKARETYGIPKTYLDYKKMLENEKLDAVAVCVPNFAHMPVAVAASKAGCNVFCEKPMSINAKDAQKMADAAKASGKIFMMGFNNRYRGDSQILKGFIEKGQLGDIYYAKTGWIRRTGIPGMGSWFTKKEEAGGGPFIDIGVHALDLCLWLMGNPKPVMVLGSARADFGPYGKGGGSWGTAVSKGASSFNVEDFGVGLIKFANGATVHLEVSWASFIKQDKFFTQLWGTKGGADLDPFAIYTESNGVQVDITPSFPQLSGHEREQYHFIDCVLKKKEPISTASHGLEIMKILDALYESAATGQAVALK